MTPDELTQAFISAGLDTPEKVSDALSNLTIQSEIDLINAELEGLAQKQTDAMRPFQDQRTQLLNQRAILIAQLPPAP